MRKYCLDLRINAVEQISSKHVLIRLTHSRMLPEILPGQFVEVRVDNSPETFLRRPISICFVDKRLNELWLLVAAVGEGTRHMAQLKAGDTLNCMLPLGKGFTMHDDQSSRLLLIGGGVGVAPLLYLGRELRQRGVSPTFLLGARSAADLLLLDEFRQTGRVLITTEDGTAGEKGFVTQHSALRNERFDRIFTCGPKPMMVAVAKYAHAENIHCEASLENLMACGIGACLCCVEKTVDGNLCVCKEGPVFDIKKLLWLN